MDVENALAEVLRNRQQMKPPGEAHQLRIERPHGGPHILGEPRPRGRWVTAFALVGGVPLRHHTHWQSRTFSSCYAKRIRPARYNPSNRCWELPRRDLVDEVLECGAAAANECDEANRVEHGNLRVVRSLREWVANVVSDTSYSRRVRRRLAERADHSISFQ